MSEKELTDFLNGKTEYSQELFRFFVDECNKMTPVIVTTLKSMIAIKGKEKSAYITQIGKNFIHVVIPFDEPFNNNMCFTKIAKVPATNQYNHHLRLYYKEDVNEEVKSFFKMAMLKKLT